MSDQPDSTTDGQKRGLRWAGEANVGSGAYYEKSWALVIGINDYSGEHPTLANAVNDAREMARVLEEEYGFDHVLTLYDQEASRDEILGWLRDKLAGNVPPIGEMPEERVGPHDRVVIFFAGHGTTQRAQAGHERGFIVPQDARQGRYGDYVDMSELREACGYIEAKHILILLDCCFSGVAAVSARADLAPSPLTLTDAFLRRITQRKAWQIMTAGDQDELAADSSDLPGHSAFTSALLAGLEGQADHNQDKLITATDLANYVKPEVTRQTTRAGSQGQSPFFNYLAGSGQGDFVFVRPGDEPIIQPPPLAPVPEVRSFFEEYPWALLVAGLVLVALIILGWLAFSGQNKLRRVYAKETAIAHEQETAEAVREATGVAVAFAPASTQTAAATHALATAMAISTQKAELAATSQALGAKAAFTPTLTATPSPTDTATPTPANTATPTATPVFALDRSTPPPDASLGDTWTRPADDMEMVYVPAGTFWMGSTDAEVAAAFEHCEQDFGSGKCERSWFEDEAPRHSLTLDAFWIDEMEVTNAQYDRCVADGTCTSPTESKSATRDSYYGESQFVNYPVIWVSWSDADAYCEWAGGRLPTEAEWEYAARGPDGNIYPWGKDPPNDTLANYKQNGDDNDTTEVGSYPDGASWVGAMDMAGNVWEWVSDWRADDYYAVSPVENPTGPDTGDQKILRGGAWLDPPRDMRSATRYAAYPDNREDVFGFRCTVAATATFPRDPTLTAATSSRQTAEAEVLATIEADCPGGPEGEFRVYWDEYEGRLGCPKQEEPTDFGNMAWQEFEGGFMLWSEFLDFVITVITSESNPRWFPVLRTWTFVPNSSECADEFTPPRVDFVQPINAFGGVWCDNPEIREALGWGLAKERSVGASIQEFEGGIILRDEDQSQAYILFRDDQTFIQAVKP